MVSSGSFELQYSETYPLFSLKMREKIGAAFWKAWNCCVVPIFTTLCLKHTTPNQFNEGNNGFSEKVIQHALKLIFDK